jgi:hypothetical protein
VIVTHVKRLGRTSVNTPVGRMNALNSFHTVSDVVVPKIATNYCSNWKDASSASNTRELVEYMSRGARIWAKNSAKPFLLSGECCSTRDIASVDKRGSRGESGVTGKLSCSAGGGGCALSILVTGSEDTPDVSAFKPGGDDIGEILKLLRENGIISGGAPTDNLYQVH